MDIDDYLTRILPHRLNALSIAVLLLKFRLQWEEPRPMQIMFDGKLQFEGTTTMFTNPATEVGVLHGRALLEFIGLKANAGKLVQLQVSSRQRDDAAIERFSANDNPLPLVTPQQAADSHPTDPTTAKRVLAELIVAAHKGVAHSSATYFENPMAAEDMVLALELTQRLIERHVYEPLGKQRPPIPVEARARE